MAEKDFKKWQDSPAPYIRHVEELKLKKRKEYIMEELQKKRHPQNPIQGYNLHQHWKIHKKRKRKKCWSCGSTNHLKFDCPVQQKKQLLKWVEELNQRIYQLESALQIILKNKAKRNRRKKRRKKKKMKKEHQQEKRDCNTAAKLKIWLLKEEEEQDLKNFLRADSYLQQLPGRYQNSVKRAYKNLFSRDLLEDMVEACTWGDEYYESLAET